MKSLNEEDLTILNKLKHWNEAYRADEPIVSDHIYDMTKDAFAKRYPNHPFVINLEPNSVPEGRKQKLPIQMRSLDKIKNIVDLKKWFEKCDILPNDVIALGPKWDGLSLLDHTPYAKCWTRGGEDNDGMMSDGHLSLIDRRPRYFGKIEYSGGEVIISRDNFKKHWMGKINPKTGEVYKTARGVMSGLMRNDEPSEMLKYVDYIRYFSPDLEFLPFDEYIREINELNSVKHPIVTFKASEINDDIMSAFYDLWSEEYEIDGIVLTIVSPERREALGRHSKSGNPRYSVAYKGDFEERVQTSVLSVTCKVSKQGLLKPTVQLEPVFLSGAEVSNPTGYNMKWIFDNKVAKGSIIEVKRSGEVIPKIIKTISYDINELESLADELVICPACGGLTAWNDNFVEIICTNKVCCGKKLAENISFFEIMKFEEFGEGAIEKLYGAGFTSVSSILRITDKEFLEIDGLGSSSLLSFRSQVKAKFQDNGVPLSIIMHSSNKFAGLGSTTLQLIIDNLDMDVLGNSLASTYLPKSVNDLVRVSGIGDKTIEAFVFGFSDFCNWFSGVSIATSYWHTPEIKPTGNKCEGMTVCFSGFRDEDMEKYIISQGGEVKGSYSKKVTHLIVADENASTSKIVKAKADGCLVVGPNYINLI